MSRERLRRKSIEIFLEHASAKLRSLRQALAAGDAEALANTAHAMAGSAGFVDARRLVELAQELEGLASKGRLEGCEIQLRKVEAEHDRVLRDLEQTLRRESAT